MSQPNYRLRSLSLGTHLLKSWSSCSEILHNSLCQETFVFSALYTFKKKIKLTHLTPVHLSPASSHSSSSVAYQMTLLCSFNMCLLKRVNRSMYQEGEHCLGVYTHSYCRLFRAATILRPVCVCAAPSTMVLWSSLGH